jgi:MFS family permease
MSQLLQFPQVFVVLVLFSLTSMAAVIFTPAFPLLVKEFQIDSVQAQWMMTLFLLGTAFGRLPYGPLANRFGRKNALFLGLSVSVAGTFLILYADSYPLLCFGRLIQAFGVAAALKIGYTMIGDLHEGPAATKVLSYALLAYAVLPGIGTTVSGFLTNSYGWRGGFWFFLFFTLLLTLSCIFLPETLKERDRNALHVRKILKDYALQFKDGRLFFWSSLMGISTAVLFIFSQEAPFLAIDVIGMTPKEYGLFYLVPAFGIVCGSLLTIWMADRVSMAWGILIGIAVLFLGSMLMGAFFLGTWINGWALFLPQVIVQMGDALVYTNASSEALTFAKDKSNASAVMLFINSCIGVLGTFAVGMFAFKSTLMLPLVFLAASVLMVCVWLLLYRR